MATIRNPGEEAAPRQVFERLTDLYEDSSTDENNPEGEAMDSGPKGKPNNLPFDSSEHGPSVTIPRILIYLRDNDAHQDADWNVNFPIIQGYLADTHRQMVTGSLGFRDPKLRTALEEARVMVKVHLRSQKLDQANTPWTTDTLRGQTTQGRLLTYPGAFPLPNPDRANSRYRPLGPMPRPDDTSPLRHATFNAMNDIDVYIQSENRFFQAFQWHAMTGKRHDATWENTGFDMENKAYEWCINGGLVQTCANAPPPLSHDDIGSRGASFYTRRGWQRAALQLSLNLFTSHENRVINTPWRRLVLPYDSPAPLPRDVAYAPRTINSQTAGKTVKDPFSWIHWSFQYTGIVDFLADCHRKRYNRQSWNDFSASELPMNFRGPHINRGLSVHDRHWLKVGEELEKVEDLLHGAWGAAPRPLLRAILRDIDAGRHQNTGGPNMHNSRALPIEDNDDMQDRRRYWRRDIRRRPGIDNREGSTNDDDFKLIDNVEIAWLRYLCEPSYTLQMCDPTKQPTQNLLILFDAKLQSYFRDLAVSGAPDSKPLDVWATDKNDINQIISSYKPNTVIQALGYINGCAEGEITLFGDTDPDPEHPNATYQFSLEEAEFLCVELYNLGRCIFIPRRGPEPATVGRPEYDVHPEDRVVWRYTSLEQFRETSTEYMKEMIDHYHSSYGDWSLYKGSRPRFSRELEFILDHAGPEFRREFERAEVTEERPATEEALARRRAFIKNYLVPEGLYQIDSANSNSTESERDLPFWGHLASWEAAGTYLTEYHERIKEEPNTTKYYYWGKPYQPQTSERTIQFFRNLAYRMGRTMRYVGQIKERLQYLENAPKTATAKKILLDLSADIKQPRPSESASAGMASTTPSVVEKWWHVISANEYNRTVERWRTAIREGSGELELLPPSIEDVLAKADPDASFRNLLKENQDPFTVIREGILDDCFRNRPAMYPARLSVFRDQGDKESVGYERPDLFVWATKTQRRYQAQHTRRRFFNMQRWPPSRIPPHRLRAIREREDDVSRLNPSKPDQAYGILTHRVPIGKEKPQYIHPFIHHAPIQREWEPDYSKGSRILPPPGPHRAGPIRDIRDTNISSTTHNFTQASGIGHSNNHSNTTGDRSQGGGNKTNRRRKHKPSKGNMTSKNSSGAATSSQKLVPFTLSDEKFAPGPAAFVMGDTLLQKIMVSEELNNVLYPPRPFYKTPLLGLPDLLRRLTTPDIPLIPLLPPVSRANIPRSNPRKRPVPIEFLNSSSTKKQFRSDAFAPLRPGGIGGQFAAATIAQETTDKSGTGTRTPTRSIKPIRTTKPATPGAPLTPIQTISAPTTPASSNTKKTVGFRDQKTPTRIRPDPSLVTPKSGQVVGASQSGQLVTPESVLNQSKGRKGSGPNDTPIPYNPWMTPDSGAGGIAKAGTAPAYISSRHFPNPNLLITPPTPTPRPTGISPVRNPNNRPAAALAPVFIPTPAPVSPAPVLSPLRVYPDPSPDEAQRLFLADFPRGWISTPAELIHLYNSAIMALEFSIRHQIADDYGIRVNVKQLGDLVGALPSLQSVSPTVFDLHSVARLLEAVGVRFGPAGGLRLQLGVVQEVPDNEQQRQQALLLPARRDLHPARFVAYLVGSKHNGASDKVVVWIRLTKPASFMGQLINPYNNLPYNCYQGICERQRYD